MTLIVNVSDLDDDYEKSTIARMISKTIVVDTGYTSQCYEFTGATAKGYGVVTFRHRKLWLVHRLAWKILGPEPLHDGMTLDHLCEYPRCWNVEHLEQVTMAVNQERYWQGYRATHPSCPQGHDFTPENTWISPSTGERKCRKCRQARRAARRALSV